MKFASSLGLACVLACALVACGGNSSGDGGGGSPAAGMGAAGTTAGTGGMGAGAGGSGGTGGVPSMMMTMVPPNMMMNMQVPGMGEEGNPCVTTETSCNAGLVCSKLPEPFDGVCGRPCMMDTDCKEAGEVCGGYIDPGPAICINLVPAWDLYAFQETSACKATSTPIQITETDEPYGLCLDLCLIEGVDPSKLPKDFPMDLLNTCTGGQGCVDIGLAPSGSMAPDGGMPEPVVGACGIGVARGEVCDFMAAKVCTDYENDSCSPTDPTDMNSERKCFQDCSDPGDTCDAGTCTENKDAAGMVINRYCLP